MIWLPLVVAAGLLANALRLRRRLGELPRLPVSGRRGCSLRWDGSYDTDTPGHDESYGLLLAEGAVVSGQLRRAACAYARHHGIQVLDLIPRDLPVERALDLARGADRHAYRTDPLALGHGAGYATVVDEDLLQRTGTRPRALDPGEYGAVTLRLRQYARAQEGDVFAADLAVVPSRVPRRVPSCAGRRAWLRGLGVSVRWTVGASMTSYALVLASLAVAPRWGAVTAAVYCAVPYLVFTGVPVSPRDLHRMALLRLVLTPWNWWRTLAEAPCPWERRREQALADAREWYGTALADEVERFFHPRRDDCPWCGARAVQPHMTTDDVIQAKPGRFTLDRCRECGHIFQNPRLNTVGLEFYRRDVYDGLAAESAEHALAAQRRVHTARADMAVAAHLAPRAWLDVGTGHGHFCRAARAVLPDTEFDGLDTGDGVQEAAARGWLRRPHRGALTDLVDELAGRYDVISMHRHLEQVPDPATELDVAIKMLPPGGHLLVELPDPECPAGRLLRRFWAGWLQPRHLHLIPIGNLERALTARGMRIVARQRRRAHQWHDLASAALIALQAFGPPPGRPWARRARASARVRYAIAVAGARPLGATAALLDRLLAPLVPGPGNTYRVLARKDEG
ncbi:class I SAM-dependent methyltransferase [Actinomadura sp. NPDC047616]|uniref:class I SAM-dependent methyltransferase n=1 Tax=Actinomadura sp. NPDC047616 TaxID=3155914 RepID=UPI0033EBBB4E